jgi:hypothetical protein
MCPIDAAILDEETHDVPDEKPCDDPMFFYKGICIGSLFSFLFWGIIFWAIICGKIELFTAFTSGSLYSV